MNFKQLITSNHWLSVKAVLTSLYPDQEDNMDAYEEVYQQLLQMDQADSDMHIVLTQCFEDETGEPSHVDVAGINSMDSENGTGYAIEFTPWKKWLGMGFGKETMSDFTELEIIAHCLYEMTFIAFDETEIQGSLSDIKNIAEEFENLTPEEQKRNTKSLDDIFKDLNDEDVEDENVEDEDGADKNKE